MHISDIVLFGICHETATLNLREKVSLSGEACFQGMGRLVCSDAISEIVIYSTCNRLEFILVSAVPVEALTQIKAFVKEHAAVTDAELDAAFYTLQGLEAVRHFFGVVAGLKSMIPGETQITGQIKKAYAAARKARSAGVVLNRLFHKAFFAAKKIRTETAVGRHTVSVAHAAVELAREHFPDFSQCRVLVIGTGEIGGVAARKVAQYKPGALFIVNRTHAKACELAAELDGQALVWNELYDVVEKVDLIISSTVCNNYILCYDYLLKLSRPLLLIDIGLPRNIEPRIADAPNCTLYNLDDLQRIVQRHIVLRRQEALIAEDMLDTAATAYDNWLRDLALSPTIAALNAKLSAVVTAEMARAGFDSASSAQTEKLTRAIVNRVLHDPVKYLKHEGHRRNNHAYLDMLRKLFNLDTDIGKDAI